MSSHNERIAAKREKVCLDFLETTSSNLTTAKHYCQMAAFDLERAVSLFYDAGGEALPDEEEVRDEAEGDHPSGDEEVVVSDNNHDDKNNDPISSIMKSAKEATAAAASSSPFKGRAFSLNSENNNSNDESPESLRVKVVFYKDGFTAQEEHQKPAAGSTGQQPRRRGVHSFSAAKEDESNLLPPMRDYESNQQFIQNVQQSVVPFEFRRFDSQRRPVPVSILLDDRRPQPYPMDQWDKQQQQQQHKTVSSFQGTGHSLGGGGGGNRQANATSTAGNQSLTAWFWSLLLIIVGWFKSMLGTIRPLSKHVVDPDRPTTTISLRLPARPKEKVAFNTHHTIADLYRFCQIELEQKLENLELLAGFPPKALDCSQKNNSKTLEEANLLNSAVDVRILSTPNDKRRN